MKKTKKTILQAVVLTAIVGMCNIGQAETSDPVVQSTYVGTADGKTAIVINIEGEGEDQSAVATGKNSIAVGNKAIAEGISGIAIGSKAKTINDGGVALGWTARATGYGSIAIGDNALAGGLAITGDGEEGTHDFAVAIGGGSRAYHAFDVALGSYSETREVTQVRGMTIGGRYYDFGETMVVGAVSVGTDEIGAICTRQLQYVAPGRIAPDSTDGVNGSQLYAVTQAVDYNSGRIDSLSGRVDKVGAGAAALAALHPLDYDADNKLSFASGIGNYAGASAMAVGAFYRPNDNAMISMAGSMGGGENMVNLGVSFAIGRGTSPYKSKQAMVQTIEDLRSENLQLKDKMTQQDERIAKQDEIIAKLIARVDALSQDN